MQSQTMTNKEAMTTTFAAGPQRKIVWIGALCLLLLWGLSLLGGTPAAYGASGQSTIPEVERTKLLGPIDQITSASEWVVAGIPVHLSGATKVDERVGQAVVGAWARVDGQGDGSGGLNAYRIKILPVHPAIKLEGRLTSLSSSAAAVDSIPVAVDSATRIVGNPQPNVDRVEVRAAAQTGGGLLALRIQKEGAANTPPDDPNEDEPDAQDGVQLYGIISQRPTSGNTGLWTVSGVAVAVSAQTKLVERVGPLVEGAWVQVQGTVDNSGQLVARRMRTISQRRYHRVKGVLQELTASSLRVGGIPLQRDDNTKVEDNPTIGQWVEVDARLLNTNSLLAVKIEGDDGENENEDRNTVEFTARIKSLPSGSLYGQWQVGERTVMVTSGVTSIDEHKGAVAVGALVKVEGTLNQDNSIAALEITVKRGEEDDNQPGDGQQYTRFTGLIESLPANGLHGRWTVNGKSVVVDERTELEGDGNFAVGDRVKVKGYLQTDGSILAREIEKEDDGGNGEDDEVKFTGAIDSLPAGGLLGEWGVAGKRVLVTPQTELKDSSYTVGEQVKVEGHKRQDGVIVAEKVEKDD